MSRNTSLEQMSLLPPSAGLKLGDKRLRCMDAVVHGLRLALYASEYCLSKVIGLRRSASNQCEIISGDDTFLGLYK